MTFGWSSRVSVARAARKGSILEGGHAPASSDDERRERGAVPGAGTELDQRITRGQAEEAERQQVSVRGADGGEAGRVERERRVGRALLDVFHADELLARNLEQGPQVELVEGAETAGDGLDERQPAAPRHLAQLLNTRRVGRVEAARHRRKRREPVLPLAGREPCHLPAKLDGEENGRRGHGELGEPGDSGGGAADTRRPTEQSS